MTSTRPNRHVEEVIAALPDSAEREQFTHARSVLKNHLIHTREIPNGQDFLFAGPHDSLHKALRELRALENRCCRFLLFDYAQIDEYFLLRVVGQKQHYEVIRDYGTGTRKGHPYMKRGGVDFQGGFAYFVCPL